MIFHPNGYIKKEGCFILPKHTEAIAHACLNHPLMKEFWHNFTFAASVLSVREHEECSFSVGNIEKLPLDGSAYTIHITPDGICVCAENERALRQGFVTLLDQIRPTDDGDTAGAALDCCQIKDQPLIRNRMAHFCIFPETELWELQRFIRFCGALKYTHVVLEFWGMLRYDCMKALAWQNAFSKAEILPIIQEARALGLEIVPMFNHWGHASAGRVMHGKHVVLDQDPRLQHYFSEDGWCWDIRKDKVKTLLHEIRKELTVLCGEGSYFHIGCDEAYNFDFSEENLTQICDFINEISDEMRTQGRRVVMWGDMILYRYSHYDPKNRYTCNAPSPEVEKWLLNRLNKEIVIADWQYNADRAPVETASVFTKAGFDCLLCPWDVGIPQLRAVLSTVRENSLNGFMHTTWHTLSSGMPYVLLAAVGGFEKNVSFDMNAARTYTAALLRKVMPSGGDYRRSGWSKIQILSKW